MIKANIGDRCWFISGYLRKGIIQEIPSDSYCLVKCGDQILAAVEPLFNKEEVLQACLNEAEYWEWEAKDVERDEEFEVRIN